jgi:hypothetical protein
LDSKKVMSNFPTYLIDVESITKFVEALREKGWHVKIIIDEHITAHGSHYTGYEAVLENGGRLVFWINIYPSSNDTTLTIGNPSGRLGRVALELAMRDLDILGQRLGQ